MTEAAPPKITLLPTLAPLAAQEPSPEAVQLSGHQEQLLADLATLPYLRQRVAILRAQLDDALAELAELRSQHTAAADDCPREDPTDG